MIKNGFEYKITYFELRYTNSGQPVCNFTIGDKIKNTDPTEWINYKVTVWDELHLKDGDKVKLKNIRDIEVSKSVKNGKVYHSFTADIDDGVGAPRQQKQKEEKPKVDMSDCNLPFDLG